MNRLLVAAALSAALLGSAIAQPAESGALTVAQAMDVTNGLSQLSRYEEVDPDGKRTTRYYKFGADLMLLIATNIDLGKRVNVRFQSATNDLIMQLSDGAGKVPDEKKGVFDIEVSKLFAAPSRVGFYHIKREALCLEAAPPSCPVANPIPLDVLAQIVPIIDR